MVVTKSMVSVCGIMISMVKVVGSWFSLGRSFAVVGVNSNMMRIEGPGCRVSQTVVKPRIRFRLSQGQSYNGKEYLKINAMKDTIVR